MTAYHRLFATADDPVRMLTCYRFVPGQYRPDHVDRSRFQCILLLVERDESSAPIVELNVEESTGVSPKQRYRDRLAQDYCLLVVCFLEPDTVVAALTAAITDNAMHLSDVKKVFQAFYQFASSSKPHNRFPVIC